ncbi:MAG: NAD-dependent epimerase/dehydratase family protein [Bacteroidales bacterium]|nr:NAD-dependent epimerase/dehydratase family protein [Bacteroidales bacterium]
MKTILLLGGYGFLGTNILKYIEDNLKTVFRVIVFDKLVNNQAGLRLGCVVDSYSGDFSDTMLLEKMFVDHEIDLVIHSLSTTVPALSLNSRYDIESNLVPTIELLNCMVRHNVQDIVYISSGGAVYGDAHNSKHKESDDVFPISSYGVVKLATEKYLMQYSKVFGLRPLIIRLSNPYGPYHFSKRQGICNVALDAALADEKFNVWGDGAALKDYIYVDDFVNIMFALIDRKICNQVINIGSGQLVSVNEILKLIKELVPTFTWEYGEASRFDVSHFELDLQKLHDIIGTYVFMPIREGLAKTKAWKLNEEN